MLLVSTAALVSVWAAVWVAAWAHTSAHPQVGLTSARLPFVRVLVIDNYDSFTYNLVQYLGELGVASRVVRNDALDVEAVASAPEEGLLVSPGPCTPDHAGVSLAAVAAAKVPVLGVCLGHQAIGQAFGGKVVRAERLMHGRVSPIEHEGAGVFGGLPSPFEATRYHSLIVERGSLPDVLEVTAWTAEGEIMGLRHKTRDIEGVQFHPESILTTHGKALLANWVKRLVPRRSPE
jgi:anthranilate synthase/aminodeoxychorismate synthase-like glutamine amidotransferase